MKTSTGLPLVLVFAATPAAHAAPWQEDANFTTLESANAGSCKVDAADINGDGSIDLVFANTDGTFNGTAASARPQQAYLNDGFGVFTDASDAVFNSTPYTGRSVKIRDIDGDGDNDIILGTVWITQSQLLLNDGAGNFTNMTGGSFPSRPASVGDIEVGDVDQDGALDIIMSNWGEDETMDDVVNSNAAGGTTLLWKQTGPGSAVFEDATASNMPPDELRMSWDLEFIDIDNDYNLDILVSCKYCIGSKSLWLLRNDGSGDFTGGVSTIASPNEVFADNNDVEVIDLNGDTFLDAVVLHDGISSRNRVLTNDAGAGFSIATDTFWPALENPKSQDQMIAFYDYDSDRDPDLVMGALKTADQMNPFPDRLMINGAGAFQAWGSMNVPKNQALAETKASGGTCAIVLADLNGNHKLDVAMGQYDNNLDKYVYIATDEVPADTAGPIIPNTETLDGPLQFPGDISLRFRAHDNKSPLMLHDFSADGVPYIEWWDHMPDPDPNNDNTGTKVHGTWYGEYLFKVGLAIPDADLFCYRYCAVDAAGNKGCSDPQIQCVDITGGGDTTTSATTTNSDSTPVTTGVTSLTTTSDSQDSVTMSSTLGGSDADSNTGDSLPTSGADPTTPTDGFSTGSGASETDSGVGEIDKGVGCICRGSSGHAGGLFGLLALLGLRRRRRYSAAG